jgi:chromosome segregation ATPase
MNIFQQVFASANPSYEVPKDSKPITRTTGRVMVIEGTGKSSQLPIRQRTKLPRSHREAAERQAATVELEAKLHQMNSQLKQSEGTLAKIREHNMILTKRNEDLENLIERLRKAAIETSLDFTDLQNKLDEDEKEKNEQWRFRIMEIQFEIEELKTRFGE